MNFSTFLADAIEILIRIQRIMVFNRPTFNGINKGWTDMDTSNKQNDTENPISVGTGQPVRRDGMHSTELTCTLDDTIGYALF